MFRYLSQPTVIAVLLVILSVANRSAVALAASNSEQVVFSGIGFSPSTQQPFGFWIWCEADSENPYSGACNGAMYFYAQGLTGHMDGTIREGPEGIYALTLMSREALGIQCTLTNTSADLLHGPHNTVKASCTTPGATFTDGMSSTTVVNLTGP